MVDVRNEKNVFWECIDIQTGQENDIQYQFFR